MKFPIDGKIIQMFQTTKQISIQDISPERLPLEESSKPQNNARHSISSILLGWHSHLLTDPHEDESLNKPIPGLVNIHILLWKIISFNG